MYMNLRSGMLISGENRKNSVFGFFAEFFTILEGSKAGSKPTHAPSCQSVKKQQIKTYFARKYEFFPDMYNLLFHRQKFLRKLVTIGEFITSNQQSDLVFCRITLSVFQILYRFNHLCIIDFSLCCFFTSTCQPLDPQHLQRHLGQKQSNDHNDKYL